MPKDYLRSVGCISHLSMFSENNVGTELGSASYFRYACKKINDVKEADAAVFSLASSVLK